MLVRVLVRGASALVSDWTARVCAHTQEATRRVQRQRQERCWKSVPRGRAPRKQLGPGSWDRYQAKKNEALTSKLCTLEAELDELNARVSDGEAAMAAAKAEAEAAAAREAAGAATSSGDGSAVLSPLKHPSDRLLRHTAAYRHVDVTLVGGGGGGSGGGGGGGDDDAAAGAATSSGDGSAVLSVEELQEQNFARMAAAALPSSDSESI